MNSLSPNTSRQRLLLNTKLFPLLELFRSLVFIVPIWVAFELRYISLTQLALIESIVFATQLFLELPSGAFADLIGRKYSLAVGMLLMVIGLLVYAGATSFAIFVVAGILFGAADSFISGSREALIYDTYTELGREHELVRVFARNNLFTQGGLAAATILGGLIASFGITVPIYAQAVVFGINILVACLLFEPQIDSQIFTAKKYLQQISSGIRETTKDSLTRSFSLFYVFVGGITWTCVLAINNMWLTTTGFDERQIGFTLGLVRVINGVLLFLLVQHSGWLSKSRSLIIFPLAIIIAMIPGYWLHQWAVVPVIATVMMLSSARWTVLNKFLNDHFASKHRATANSTLSMAISIFYIIAVSVAGQIGDKTGNLGLIYTIFGLMALFGLLPLGLKLRAKFQLGIHKETVKE